MQSEVEQALSMIVLSNVGVGITPVYTATADCKI